jgi:hypothetical protein
LNFRSESKGKGREFGFASNGFEFKQRGSPLNRREEGLILKTLHTRLESKEQPRFPHRRGKGDKRENEETQLK